MAGKSRGIIGVRLVSAARRKNRRKKQPRISGVSIDGGHGLWLSRYIEWAG